MSIKELFDNFEIEFNIFLNKYIIENEINIYNEFSFQHELGMYLKNKLKENPNYKVEFERNISFFGINYSLDDINYNKLKESYKNKEKLINQLKHEIDIVIYNKDNLNEKYAIELKYPSIKSYYDEQNKKEIKRANGGYPKEMYSFIKDIKFMEVLKNRNFTKTFCITLVNSKDANGNKNFYELQNNEKEQENEIYKYFRMPIEKKLNQSIIQMPVGKYKEEKAVYINGEYSIIWTTWIDEEGKEKGKYYIVSIE